jgi:phage-related protein
MGEQLRMPQARPMATVATGVSELRVRGEGGTYRVFYQTAPRGIFSCFTHSSKKPSARPRPRSGLRRNI